MAFAGLKDTEMQKKNIDVQSWGNFLFFQKKFKMIRLLKDRSKDKNMQLVHYLRNCVASKKKIRLKKHVNIPLHLFDSTFLF